MFGHHEGWAAEKQPLREQDQGTITFAQPLSDFWVAVGGPGHEQEDNHRRDASGGRALNGRRGFESAEMHRNKPTARSFTFMRPKKTETVLDLKRK